jgi:hypothetical protein
MAMRAVKHGVTKAHAVKNVAGVKFDTHKPRFDLLPWNALWEVASVMEYGSQKYNDRNWERGMRWGRLTAAAFRHLARWMMREEFDKESGYRHLPMAVCCILMLMGLVADGRFSDDDDRTQLLGLGFVYREQLFLIENEDDALGTLDD